MTLPSYIERTFIENWPAELVSLSMRTESVAMTAEDVVALGSYYPQFRRALGLDEVYDLSPALNAALAAALAKFPGGVMPRLGYCSWKGSSLMPAPVRTIKELMAVITRPDERIARTLVNAAAHRYGLPLHLREWLPMPPQSEFRAFIRHGKVAGVSQYFWQDSFGLRDGIVETRNRLNRLLNDILELGHMDDVVADLYVEHHAPTGRAMLIELNPLVGSADHCLYQARDFDGRLRFRDGSRIMAIELQ